MVEQAKMLCGIADHKGAEWTTENASTIFAVLDLVVQEPELSKLLQTLRDKARAPKRARPRHGSEIVRLAQLAASWVGTAKRALPEAIQDLAWAMARDPELYRQFRVCVVRDEQEHRTAREEEDSE